MFCMFSSWTDVIVCFCMTSIGVLIGLNLGLRYGVSLCMKSLSKWIGEMNGLHKNKD